MSSQDKAKSKSRDRGKGARGDSDTVDSTPAPATPKPTPETKWRELAAFHVTFDQALDVDKHATWQTHVYHEESGAEQVRAGVLGQSLIAWMRERAGFPADMAQPEPGAAPPAELQPADERAAPTAAPAAPALLSVGELELEELLEERAVGAPAAETRLRARLRFDLPDPASGHITLGAPYLVQLLACEEESNQTVLLAGTRGELHPNVASYLAELNFELPPLGGYQLVANVILTHAGLATAALGPRLVVVP